MLRGVLVCGALLFLAVCLYTAASREDPVAAETLCGLTLIGTRPISPAALIFPACTPRATVYSFGTRHLRFELVQGVTASHLLARETYTADEPMVRPTTPRSHAVYLICSCDAARLDLLRHNAGFFDSVHIMACESCVPGAGDVQRRSNVDMHMAGFRYMRDYCQANVGDIVSVVEDDYLITDFFVDQVRALVEMFPHGLPFFSAYRHPQGGTVFNKHLNQHVVYLEHGTHSFVTWPVASMTFTVGCGTYLSHGRQFWTTYADVDNFNEVSKRGSFLVAPVMSSMQHIGRNLSPEPYWATHLLVGNRTAGIFSRLLCDKLD